MMETTDRKLRSRIIRICRECAQLAIETIDAETASGPVLSSGSYSEQPASAALLNSSASSLRNVVAWVMVCPRG